MMLDDVLTAMRGLLWLASTDYGGLGIAFWIISFRLPAAGVDTLVCLFVALLLFYAREQTY